MSGDVEGGEEGVGFVEEVGDGGGGEGWGDDEVVVGVEEGELFWGEVGFGFWGGGYCILKGIFKVWGDEVRWVWWWYVRCEGEGEMGKLWVMGVILLEIYW